MEMRVQIKYLLEQFANNTASEEDGETLAALLKQPENAEIIREVLQEIGEKSFPHPTDAQEMELIIQQILHESSVPIRRMYPWKKWIAAAAAVLIICTAAYLWFNRIETPSKAEPRSNPISKLDIAPPNSSNAVLTLANGTKVILDSAKNGSLANEGNVLILKSAEGQITYSDNLSNYNSNLPLAYNTLTVPKGSKPVALVLADGTKVWMNAASSLHYPTTFSGNERKVDITGEAYFEVAHNANMPFIVQKGNRSVRVLGTHFNINAYDDEPMMKITLLEGSIKASIENNLSEILKPGEQAQISGNDKLQINRQADIDQVMAWKNGLFNFNKTGIGAIMRQMEKWYDLEVQYQGTIPDITLSGIIRRDIPVSKALAMLEMSGLHFTIEQKKIIVKP